MAIIKVPQSVFDAGKPLPAGWYKAKVTKIENKASSKGDSVNTWITFQVEDQTKEIRTFINSKFPIKAPKLHSAITGVQFAEDVHEAEIDTDEWLNKNLQILLDEDVYNGNVVNNVQDFAPYEKDLAPPEWVAPAL